MAKRRNHWGDKRQIRETEQAWQARLERRRILAELRGNAVTVDRDGKAFYYVQVPDEYKSIETAL